MQADGKIALEACAVGKRFPNGVQALQNVDLAVAAIESKNWRRPGESHPSTGP